MSNEGVTQKLLFNEPKEQKLYLRFSNKKLRYASNLSWSPEGKRPMQEWTPNFRFFPH